MRFINKALRRYGDTVLAVTCAGLMVADIQQHERGRQPSDLALALLASLALAWRRRHPLVVFLLVWGSVLGLTQTLPDFVDLTFGYAIVLMLSVFAVGAYTSGWHAWLGNAVICACITIFIAATAEHVVFSDVVLILLFLGTPWGFGTAARLHRERKATAATETARLLAEENTRGAAALEAERAQIARELHDIVSHAMAVTLMQARGGRRVQAVDPRAASAAFDAIEQTNTQAIGDMRRMLNVLRQSATLQPKSGEPPAPLPSLQRLPQLLDDVHAAGVEVRLSIDGDLDHVPPGVDLSAYRVIQEALTNVVKHAGPARADVTVHCHADQLELTVTDNGSQNSRHNPDGHGLNGIRERVGVLGGQVEVGPTLTGYTVHAQLPYQPAA